MTETKKNSIVIVCITIISIVFSFFIVQKFPPLPIVSDSEDYHIIASGILNEGKYLSTANHTLLIYPPLYPIFLVGSYSLSHIGAYSFVYGLQYILIGCMAILIFLILRKFSKVNLLIPIMSSLAILFWPYFVLYSQLISSEILYSFLLLLFFYFFFSIHKDSKMWLLVSTGFILGLTILTRPVALLLLPWMIIGLFIFMKIPKLFGTHDIPWKKYFIVLIVSIVSLIPWEIYVYKNYDRIIPVASNLGNVFNKANKTLAYLPETEKPSILKAKLKNVYLFWDPGASGYHLDILKEKYPIAGIAVGLYKIIFFGILLFATIGAVMHRKQRLVLYALLVILYVWTIHIILFPFPRYTLPIMPFVIIVAVTGITHGINKLKTKNTLCNTCS